MTENFCIPITAIALRVQLESEILIELFELQRKIFADNILTDEGGGEEPISSPLEEARAEWGKPCNSFDFGVRVYYSWSAVANDGWRQSSQSHTMFFHVNKI
jgi:hypothetical protein